MFGWLLNEHLKCNQSIPLFGRQHFCSVSFSFSPPFFCPCTYYLEKPSYFVQNQTKKKTQKLKGIQHSQTEIKSIKLKWQSFNPVSMLKLTKYLFGYGIYIQFSIISSRWTHIKTAKYHAVGWVCFFFLFLFSSVFLFGRICLHWLWINYDFFIDVFAFQMNLKASKDQFVMNALSRFLFLWSRTLCSH